MSISRNELIDKLKEYANNNDDPEGAHVAIDYMLIDYIDDEEIKSIWEKIEMWYA